MKLDKKFIGATTLVVALVFSGCGGGSDSSSEDAGITAAQKKAVLTTYADIALANYTDALSDAEALQTAINTFVTTPTQTNFDAAKAAWLTARESYGTTEAFRLSEGPIDAEEGFGATFGAPEGQLNAWPLDENMIDYTTAADGSTTSGNIIDTTGVFTPSGDEATEVNVTTITKEALASLNENGGDANVATGYHSIEFLLWGQDQDYNSFVADTVTNGALVAGQRPLTDFTSAANADRRLAYLQAAADLMVDDLQSMVDAWTSGTGSYREALLGGGTNAIDADEALTQIFAGLGVFIKSELANERMAVAVLTPSEEDEHSCFSDNTHRDITLNYEGFRNIIKGEYPKGTSKGTSFYSLLSSSTKAEVDTLIETIDTGVDAIDTAAATEHFDYQIQSGSSYRQNIVDTKNSMRDLGDEMVDVAADFGISLTEDDVTDPDETVIE
ncbi:imelysin family protein [Sulfurimonas sp.]|uniref:imelysin family protein n=1 Tax=Sulfurimonas sp. TaxID=2022749 RepID=UPI003D1328DE